MKTVSRAYERLVKADLIKVTPQGPSAEIRLLWLEEDHDEDGPTGPSLHERVAALEAWRLSMEKTTPKAKVKTRAKSRVTSMVDGVDKTADNGSPKAPRKRKRKRKQAKDGGQPEMFPDAPDEPPEWAESIAAFLDGERAAGRTIVPTAAILAHLKAGPGKKNPSLSADVRRFVAGHLDGWTYGRWNVNGKQPRGYKWTG